MDYPINQLIDLCSDLMIAQESNTLKDKQDNSILYNTKDKVNGIPIYLRINNTEEDLSKYKRPIVFIKSHTMNILNSVLKGLLRSLGDWNMNDIGSTADLFKFVDSLTNVIEIECVADKTFYCKVIINSDKDSNFLQGNKLIINIYLKDNRIISKYSEVTE